MPPKPTVTSLSEGKYQERSRELASILVAAARSSHQEKTAGYRNVGTRIRQERLSEGVGYRNAVLRELALSLGVSARTLQLAVTARDAYETPPTGPLTWAHYRLIARLSTKKELSFYEKLAQQESWSVRTLQSAIRADAFGGGSTESPSLLRPTGPSYVYRAEAPHLVDGDTLDIDVDLGFQTWTCRRIRLAHIDCPEASTAKGRAALNFFHSQLLPVIVTLVGRATVAPLTSESERNKLWPTSHFFQLSISSGRFSCNGYTSIDPSTEVQDRYYQSRGTREEADWKQKARTRFSVMEPIVRISHTVTGRLSGKPVSQRRS